MLQGQPLHVLLRHQHDPVLEQDLIPPLGRREITGGFGFGGVGTHFQTALVQRAPLSPALAAQPFHGIDRTRAHSNNPELIVGTTNTVMVRLPAPAAADDL